MTRSYTRFFFAAIMMFVMAVVYNPLYAAEVTSITPAEVRSDLQKEVVMQFRIDGTELKAVRLAFVDSKSTVVDKGCSEVSRTETRIVLSCKIGAGDSGRLWLSLDDKPIGVTLKIRRLDEPVLTGLTPRLVTSHPTEEIKPVFTFTGRYLKGVNEVKAYKKGDKGQREEIGGKCKVTDSSSATKLQFTCTIPADEKLAFWPDVPDGENETLSVTVRTTEDAQEAGIKAAQGAAAVATKRALELEEQVKTAQAASTGLSEKLVAQDGLIQKLQEQAQAAYTIATASQNKGVQHDNAIQELQQARTATDQRLTVVEGWQKVQADVTLGLQKTVEEVGVEVTNQAEKSVSAGGLRGIFGRKRQLDPSVRGRLEQVFRESRKSTERLRPLVTSKVTSQSR